MIEAGEKRRMRSKNGFIAKPPPKKDENSTTGFAGNGRVREVAQASRP
jgi:hypothetical protein